MLLKHFTEYSLRAVTLPFEKKCFKLRLLHAFGSKKIFFMFHEQNFPQSSTHCLPVRRELLNPHRQI